MRDLILLAVLCGISPLILRSPIAGLLVWIWIALMNPQREVYGALRGFELNQLVAVATALVWLASKERKMAPANPLTLAFLLFGAWTCVTTFLALDPGFSESLLDRTIKSLILAFAVITLANTRARIQAVLWAVVVSIGYYGVKGGGFVLMTGGRSHVFGPEDSMIADNNSLGLALVVILPLMFYLRSTSRVALTRWALLGASAMTVLAALGTYSRGALVAMAAAMATFALRSRSGVLVLAVAAAACAAAPSFLPAGWMERMSTIKSASQDESFESRVSAWRTSANIAAARPLIGGGFSAVTLTPVAQRYSSPGSLKVGRAAHSIYFEVLGDHGFVGLGLYLLIFAAAGLNTVLVLHASRRRPELAWAAQLARMLQVCLVAFLVGGAALSMAYYDGMLIIFALTASLAQAVRRPAAAAAAAAAAEASLPKWKQGGLVEVAARQLPGGAAG